MIYVATQAWDPFFNSERKAAHRVRNRAMKQRNGAPSKTSLHPRGAEGEIIACGQVLLGFTCQWATGFVGSGMIGVLSILIRMPEPSGAPPLSWPHERRAAPLSPATPDASNDPTGVSEVALTEAHDTIEEALDALETERYETSPEV